MINIFRQRKAPAIGSVCLLMALAQNASAQLEEIVVTAERRPENIQDVPISISAYTGDTLSASGINTLQDLGAYTPNLTFSQSSQVANQRIIMRGVGSVGNNAIEPSVAVFIDGVYYPRPASIVGSLSDIELVEVLRGPQGTLFGRNASMGALNIRTAQPTTEPDGELRASYGNYNDLRIRGSFSNALSDAASGRIAFHYADRDGYGRNTYTDNGNSDEFGAREDTMIRGKLHFTPSETLEVNVGLDYARVKNEGGVIEVLSDTVLPAYLGTLSVVLNPVGAAPGGPVPESTDSFDYAVNQDHRDTGDDEQWGGMLDISWTTGEHTIRSLTAYRDWHNDTFESALRLPADLLNRITRYDTETFSQELQVLSPVGRRIEYVAGIYYYDESYDIAQQFDLGPDFCPAVRNLITAATLSPAFGNAGLAQCAGGPQTAAIDADFNQDLTSWAVFGQATLNMDDRLRFTAGLRWTSDDKEGTYNQVVPNTILLPPSLTNPLAINLRTVDVVPNLDLGDDKITWMGNVSYDINDDVMVFATASTGFKSGGFNSEGGNIVINRVFAAENTLNFELGIKAVFMDNRLLTNLNFFNTRIEDFQDRQFDGLNFTVQNVGELTQKGFELDMQLTPNEYFTTTAGVSWLDSEFDSFPNATALPAVIAGVPGEDPQDLTGESNHFSPEWQVSVVSELHNRFGSGLGWYLRGELNHLASQNIGAETNQNPQSVQPAYTLLNARAGISGVDDRWEIAIYGKNLSDEGYCQTVFNQPISITLGLVDPVTLGGMQRCVVGTPRTYGMEAVYRF